MSDPQTHADWCERALRKYANSLSKDIKTDVMAWALDEIVRLRARVRELEEEIENKRIARIEGDHG